MDKHRCLWDPNHEERPERFSSILQRIRELGLDQRCTKVTPRKAIDNELELIHSKTYIQRIKSTQNLEDEVQLEKIASQFDAVYFHPDTYDLALLSAGSGIDLVTQVVRGQLKNGFALIRPPGHHAMKTQACGYCFFNNIAIAAKHAVEHLGLERVLIVDWDVHHGQATQYSFDDSKVMYISIHRYENGSFWPELIESNSNHVGKISRDEETGEIISDGLGYNCNIALNETGLHDKDYLAIFHNVILPLAYHYNPQLVLVSAGYDAAIGMSRRRDEGFARHLCSFHSFSHVAGRRKSLHFSGGRLLYSVSI